MNKKKLYNTIMKSISKLIKKVINETKNFNNSDIFNKEESLYDDSNIVDNYTYKNILEKLKNAELVSEEEYEYVHRFKYKVESKDELEEIIENYSKKNPIVSLNWLDTSKITDMSLLFSNSKYNGDISEWDTSSVTNMSMMFWCAESFNQSIENWDVSNVTDMHGMFSYADLFNQPIGNWDVSKVTNMEGMFLSADSFNQTLKNWNISNVTDMSRMFCGAEKFNQRLEDWDVSNVTNMKYMFAWSKSFNQNISNWKLNPNIDNKNMFYNCTIKENYKPKINN